MGSWAISRMDMGAYTGAIFWPLLESLYRIRVPLACQGDQNVEVAHIGRCKYGVDVLGLRSQARAWSKEGMRPPALRVRH